MVFLSGLAEDTIEIGTDAWSRIGSCRFVVVIMESLEISSLGSSEQMELSFF